MVFGETFFGMDRDLGTIRLFTWRLLMVVAAALPFSCTSKPEERMPGEKVMHFPSYMAQFGSYLAVSSSSADARYHSARMVVLDTTAIKQVISSGEAHEPIEWDKIVRSNFLIPMETGEIYFSDSYLVTAGRENSQLIAMPITNGVSKCTDPSAKVDTCANASTLTLPAYDPFSLVGVTEQSNEEQLLVGYLSSDRIDIVKIDKSKTKDVLSIPKSFNAMDFVRSKLDADTIKNQRIITRKIVVTAKNDSNLSKVYFLLEQHSQKISVPTKPKASFLVAIKTSDLLSNSVLTDQKIEVWNLNDLAAVAGATDFAINSTKNEAYVLARVPEALFKIDLTKSSVSEVATICLGATSMAVDEASDTIALPCFTSNRVTAFSMDTLKVKATSKVIGRGPSFVVIDKTTGYIFCTLSNDGIVAILEDVTLNYLGHVFDKAPLNRIGS